MIRRKKIPDKDLFRQRHAKNKYYSVMKYLRHRRNGCLEYVRSNKGRSSGTQILPKMGIGGGKNTQSLRTWIWERHNGPLRKGTYLKMSCGNRMCFEYNHIITSNSRTGYQTKGLEFFTRFTKYQIRTILFLKGKVPASVVSSQIGLNPEVVRRIWNECECNKSIITPKDWRPHKVIIQKIEKAALSNGKIFLGPWSLSKAKGDIYRSGITPEKKQLVERMISGEGTKTLSAEFKLSRLGVLYVFRRALADLYKEFGYRPWMLMASKGVISH
jgi:hypothetical protein